ncbi:MAG: PhoH family protein [Bacteroidales bacterium]|nr:PhoH family protein [Bacteroidales bacterium]
MGKPKIYVLDTNVILHDHKAIRQFKENDLVIPTAVIEEADKFKKGNDTLAYHARGFMRDLDKITNGKSFGKNGVPIGKGLGRIKVEPNHPFPEELAELFKDDTQDHRILSTAMWVRDTHPGTFVALVTKDVNLRLKAKAAGMAVQDYLTDKVDDDKLDERLHEVLRRTLDSSLMQALCYGPETSVDWEDVQDTKPEANQLFKFSWEESAAGEARPEDMDSRTVCARYDADRGKIVLVKAREAYGIHPRNDEQKMAIDACLNPKIDLVALTGGAGTGKTLIALASALEQERDYDQIILSRPTVILGNQDIGYLPGDQKTKMSPFLQPLMDNLNVIKEKFRPGSREAQRIDAMLTMEKLIIEPLAYIRGRSLGKCFFIIDEAQNLTPHEIKTIITRAGEGTKMVFTGDVFQIDQPYLDQWSNGLSHISEKLSGQKIFQHVFLRKGERSPLSDLAAKLL